MRQDRKRKREDGPRRAKKTPAARNPEFCGTDEAPVRRVTPCCRHCTYAGRLRDGRRTLLVCVNCPGRLGQLTCVAPDATCPDFRPPQEPPLRLTPPEPPDDSIRYIALTKGMFATVDAADYEWLGQRKWHVSGRAKVYAASNWKGKRVYMHRLIMNPPPGYVVDHIDGNGLNNRRSNLRICTQMQNQWNRRGMQGTSAFKGVSYNKEMHKWEAAIIVNKKKHPCGFFEDEDEAALACDRKAWELCGPYARLNFPDRLPQEAKSEIRISKSETNPKKRNR